MSEGACYHVSAPAIVEKMAWHGGNKDVLPNKRGDQLLARMHRRSEQREVFRCELDED